MIFYLYSRVLVTIDHELDLHQFKQFSWHALETGQGEKARIRRARCARGGSDCMRRPRVTLQPYENELIAFPFLFQRTTRRLQC